ncbi:acetyltransferase [Amycolatopsis sp. FDAARGOS 1241]|uniref:acetyltransferase n=1 Tax=Amycolatopsis sp. FDAARGOS 1241 TaxID=2778070 RepID=UPI001951503A|nr:acetyltransferase [Amycolatopsis sp. FDAARGOS 1241]QRP46617.1 acetyltransferase [Amycolatopsis sp. FDAARGOS 1241]
MTAELRPVAGEREYPRLLQVWRSSVEATHDFLTPADVEFFAERVPAYFPAVDLTVAVVDGAVAGFSGVADGDLSMLFVHADYRGEGIGSALLRKAFAQFPQLTVDVNEQNSQAVGFYLHHGFVVAGRSEFDSEGRPFPLLHLKRA